MSDIYTLAGEDRLQQEIRKSRFHAHAAGVDNADAALAFVARISVRDATHNCWAFRIGANYRFNDDGEPGGSAGRPILLAIDGQAMDRVVVVVTRWYGGIKLGVGGLARAYGGCASECLRLAERRPLIERVQTRIHCDYAGAPALYARLREFDALRVAERSTLDGAEIDIELPASRVDALTVLVRDLTRGRGSLTLPP